MNLVLDYGFIMGQKKPVFLNLLQIHLPITGLVSIMHRISGVALLLFLPFFLWGLAKVTGTPEDYHDFLMLMQGPLFKIIYGLGIISFSYHMLAGVRHLIMDLGFCESLKAARLSAFMLLISITILAILIGIRLC